MFKKNLIEASGISVAVDGIVGVSFGDVDESKFSSEERLGSDFLRRRRQVGAKTFVSLPVLRLVLLVEQDNF